MAVWDDIKKQHRKVKKKGFKAMLSYFWDYYKIHTAVILFVSIFVFYLVKDMASNLPYGFYAIMINATLHPDSEAIGEDFAGYAGIDTQNYDVLIDTNSTLSTEGYNSYDVSTQERIMAITAAGDLDVMVTDQAVFEQYARNDYMTDLSTLMSKEELAKYEGKIYYVDKAVIEAIQNGTYENSTDASVEEGTATEDESTTGATTENAANTADNFVLPDPSTMENPIPVGIILTDSAFMQETQTFAGSVPVFGIIGNSTHTQEALKFLEYMYTYTAS